MSKIENLYISDKGFIFDYSTGLTYNLNPTGMFVLDKLLKEVPRDEILRSLQNRFGVDDKTAAIDVDDFLQQLSALNLLELGGAGQALNKQGSTPEQGGPQGD